MNRKTTDNIIVYARKLDMQGAFCKPMSIRYVTDMCYLENIPEVQVCSSLGG